MSAGATSSAGGGGGGGGELPSAGQPSLGGAGGVGGADEVGTGGMLAAGAGGACTQTCTTTDAGQFCGQDQVTWLCTSVDFDAELFNEQCQDAGTGLVRYCCPPEFAGECP